MEHCYCVENCVYLIGGFFSLSFPRQNNSGNMYEGHHLRFIWTSICSPLIHIRVSRRALSIPFGEDTRRICQTRLCTCPCERRCTSQRCTCHNPKPAWRMWLLTRWRDVAMVLPSSMVALVRVVCDVSITVNRVPCCPSPLAVLSPAQCQATCRSQSALLDVDRQHQQGRPLL